MFRSTRMTTTLSPIMPTAPQEVDPILFSFVSDETLSAAMEEAVSDLFETNCAALGLD